jgi:hypothetical protein
MMSLESDGGMIYWQGKTEELGEKPVPLPPQIPHGLDPGANPGLRHERPVTNDLSHGTALDWTYRRTSCCVIKLCWQSNRHKTIVIKTAYTAVLHKRFQPHAVIIRCTFSPCKTCFTKGKSWKSVSFNSNKGKVKCCHVSQHSLQLYFSIINCHSLLLIND